MKNKWIKKDDTVLIIAGNDKGKIGTVLAKKDDRILVQGVNVRKKHLKRRERTAPSEIVDIELPVHVSNVALCNTDGKKIDLKVREKGGEKELYYVEGSKEVVFRTLKKSKS